MKNLWRHIPPHRSDLFGFREVIKNTDGVGLIDDSSQYHDGSMFGGRKGGRNSRSSSSEVRMEHVISGSAELLLQRFGSLGQEYDPAFALVTHGPAASMIGTDMDDIARKIAQQYRIPAAFVNINGHKTYDCGVEATLAAMARLLVKPAERRADEVNLIGGCRLDWGSENCSAVMNWCRERKLKVCSVWGMGDKKNNLERASEAAVSLVLTASGLETAKWLEQQFQIPYITGVPFGKTQSERLYHKITSRNPAVESCLERAQSENGRRAVIIGEQFMANAFRTALINEYDFSEVRTASFFAMDKALMQPGDVKLKSENQLKEFMEPLKNWTVFAPSLYQYYKPEQCRWISLPGDALLPPSDEKLPKLVENGLDCWLAQVL